MPKDKDEDDGDEECCGVVIVEGVGHKKL